MDAQVGAGPAARDFPLTPGESSGSDEWPLELLERELSELAAHIHAGMCRWLGLVAEFDRREGWADWGCKSCAQWIAWRCALAPPAAREHVRVARRLRDLPLIRAAFEKGELSYSQVRALSRVATEHLEPALLELARYSTAAQLERTLRAYRGVLERELSPAEIAHGDRYLVLEDDEDGALLIRGRLPAEEGALVVAALDAARDSLRAKRPDEPSSQARAVSAEAEAPDGPLCEQAPPSNAGALLLMAETLLASGPAERSGGDSYQLVVHVDATALAHRRTHASQEGAAEPNGPAGADEPPEGACQLDDGRLLHPETARRLACDSSVVRILERDGRPLSVGRRTRSVPPALRRALQSRDHCCRFPGCTQRRFLHAHHIEHWARGGATALGNLVQLCRFHHRLVHEGGYTLEHGHGGGELCFRRPDGQPISAVPEAESVEPGELPSRNHRRGLQISPDTCASRWAGERLDLALTVDALVGSDPRLA
jgi:hypothetical protein